MVEAWKSKREKRRSRRRRYAVAAVVAVVLAIWLYEFVLPLLNNPNPQITPTTLKGEADMFGKFEKKFGRREGLYFKKDLSLGQKVYRSVIDIKRPARGIRSKYIKKD